MEEVVLRIEEQEFKVKKDLLMEHSDYFRAMFSGNFVENDQNCITIDVIDAESMNIIIRYMNIGLIDLSEFTLPVIANLATSANFLQITELIKQIEYCLDLQLCNSNWIETMAIAEQASYSKLKHLSTAFGLLAFKSMKQEHIPNIDTLFWYLSHPYLDADTELDVFKFGFEWILQKETGADALLIIIGCLDMKRVRHEEITEMLTLIVDYKNSLAEKVLQCINHLMVTEKINSLSSLEIITQNKCNICETFSERVYHETLDMVKESKERKLVYTPIIPIWTHKQSNSQTDTIPKYEPHHMYTFTKEDGFVKWLEVAEKTLWGWNVTSWGANKLIVVCGEFGRGMGVFMKDVKVYDSLRKEWTVHGAQLPARRHGGVSVIGDSLFIIGGVGSFRVVQDSAIVYDLKQRSYRQIAKFPEAMQSPAVCCHKGSIYAAAYNVIYKYEDLGDTDRWKPILTSNMKSCDMTSFHNHIYCSQKFFSQIYMFRPEIDTELTKINTIFPTVTMICLNNSFLIFHGPISKEPPQLIVMEGKRWDSYPKFTKHIWKAENLHEIKINDVAGSTAIVLELPSLETKVSNYHQKYINRYTLMPNKS